MNFLLDTNVIAEWTKPRPNSGVITWLDEADEDRVFLSVATLAELRHGVDRLAPAARRKKLDSWLREELPLRFESRVLAVTAKSNLYSRERPCFRDAPSTRASARIGKERASLRYPLVRGTN